jgi:mono/diheme cytochrome c family protein
MASELAVVTFRGQCDAVDLYSSPERQMPLGITHVTDGVVLPFTDVDCDSIRSFLRKRLAGMDPLVRDAALGRAVGRVLAHELFHIFVGTGHHSSEGVAKPAFTETELLSEQFVFETAEFRILRASLKAARQQNSKLRAAASPVSGRFIFQENGCVRCHGAHGQGSKNAPSIRAGVDRKAIASRLRRAIAAMSGRAKGRKVEATALDEDEIADIVSFLSAMN